jgi:hypothetical protein
VDTLVVFCESSVQLGGITLQCCLVNKMCLTSLWRMMVQSLPIRRGLQISATESMYVVNEVRFRLIPIMSVWRVTFVTFCIYVGEKRELGVIWWSLNCQFVTLKHVLTTCTAQCHTAFLCHQYCGWMEARLCNLGGNGELKTLSA